MEVLVKDKKRVIDAGEVFTPKHVVIEMMGLLDKKLIPTEKYLDNSSGNGNFLMGFIKLKNENIPKPYDSNNIYYNILFNLSNIYGIDIQEDNVLEARERLYNYILDYINTIDKSIENNGNEEYNKLKDVFLEKSKEIINYNVIFGDYLKKVTFVDNEEKPLVLYSFDIDPKTLNYTKIEIDL